jgi:putative molybdopterin biosynthesis protein
MKEFMTPQEVAEMLSISRGTVYRLIERRELPIYHIARTIRIKESDVELYLSKVRLDALKNRTA